MQYLLTVKYRFDAIDDCEARQRAISLLVEMNEAEVNKTGETIGFHDVCKLQRLKTDGAPEGVKII